MEVRTHHAVIRELLPLGEGPGVAEVGCGDGAIARFMAREGARVTALEYSENQLRRARAAGGAGEETYVLGLGEALPFASESFDVVVYFNTLHHIPLAVQAAALEEAGRVLRGSGLLYVSEPVAEGAYFELVRPIEDETAVRAAAYDALKAAATTSAMSEELELTYMAPLKYESFSAFRDYVVAVDESRREKVAAMSEDLERRFLAAAEHREDGYHFVTPCRVNVLRRE